MVLREDNVKTLIEQRVLKNFRIDLAWVQKLFSIQLIHSVVKEL